MLPHRVVHHIRSMPLLNIGQRLGPPQRRALPLRVHIRPAPVRDLGDPLLRLVLPLQVAGISPTQYSQPFITDTRSRTSSISVASSPVPVFR